MTTENRTATSYFDGLQTSFTPYGAKLVFQRSGIPVQQGDKMSIPYDVVGVFDTSLEHLKMMVIYLERQLKAYEKIHGKVPVNKDILAREKIDLKQEWDGQEYQGSLEHLKLLTMQMHRLLRGHESKNGAIIIPAEDVQKFEIDLAKEW